MFTDFSTRATTLRTLDGEITLDAALEEEQNMLRRLTYWDRRVDFGTYLLAHSADIDAIVLYHLGLRELGCCYLAPADD